MPVTPQQIQFAQAEQGAAAHDLRPQVRLIAGPGSGKSFTIEERVCWLLENGADAQRVFAISFTNASAQDLRLRIAQFCQSRGQNGTAVSVTTMHSLALRMLRAAHGGAARGRATIDDEAVERAQPVRWTGR
jgi:DNA helicase II / ATP-dependent DNA helicase PcrA